MDFPIIISMISMIFPRFPTRFPWFPMDFPSGTERLPGAEAAEAERLLPLEARLAAVEAWLLRAPAKCDVYIFQ